MTISTCLDSTSTPHRNQDMNLYVFIPPSFPPQAVLSLGYRNNPGLWASVFLSRMWCLGCAIKCSGLFALVMTQRSLFCLIHRVKVGITGISLGVIRTKCRFLPKKFASRIRSCLRDLGFSFDWCFRIQYFFFLQSLFWEVKKNSHEILYKFGLKMVWLPALSL